MRLLKIVEKELYKLKERDSTIDNEMIYEFIITCKQRKYNYSELIDDIENARELNINTYVKHTNEYNDGKPFKDIVMEIKIDNNCCYKIIFSYETDYMGYCHCEKRMKGYNLKYGCCGYNCDWCRPYMDVVKIKTFKRSKYNGTQHDMWDEIELESKKDKVQKITAEINRLNEELRKIGGID